MRQFVGKPTPTPFGQKQVGIGSRFVIDRVEADGGQLAIRF
jgi:hypothetical protein